MKKLLIIFALTVLGCSLPFQLTAGIASATPTPSETPTLSPTPPTIAEPGTDANPLILALAPAPLNTEDELEAGQVLAAQLESLTGYRIVVVAPTTEQEIVDDFGRGNTHIAVLSPFGFLLAYDRTDATALLASVRDGQTLYGAQFIVNRDSQFQSFYDEVRGQNVAEADEALHQLADKKPCWSDEFSPSGYVVPLGLLNRADVPVRGGAFLEGQPNVVRAVYAADICDFGATFIDARESPALEADYPDVTERVTVLWRIPPVIPYEVLAVSADLSLEMRRVLLRAFSDAMLSPEGKAAIQTVYGIDAFQPVEDDLYAQFGEYVEASHLALEELIKRP